MSAIKASPQARRKFLSIEATAEALDVSTRTVRRWIAEGQLPAYRLGDRLVRIDPADVDQMMSRIPAGGAAAC